jgi:hypothetical protein
LTKGDSPEAQAGHATWKDVSKDTFERFSQFAYTGDYSIPKTEKRNTDGVLTPPSSPYATTVSSITRGRHGSEASASTVDPQLQEKASQPLFDNELGREPVIDKPADDDGTILNQPTLTKKARKKGRRKNPEAPTVRELVVAELLPPEPQPEQVPEEPEPVDPEPVEIEPTPAEPEQNPEQPEPKLVVNFPALSYPLHGERDNYHGTCEPSETFEKDHSYSKVLLSHASLYVLGDFQLIDSLKALALFKLHKTLCAFQLDKENIGDITDLARYTYSKDGNEGVEGLRGLVCQYMGIHAMELSKDQRFMKLLAEGGQIVIDFFKLGLQGRR